jgi:hypothetical protein
MLGGKLIVMSTLKLVLRVICSVVLLSIGIVQKLFGSTSYPILQRSPDATMPPASGGPISFRAAASLA